MNAKTVSACILYGWPLYNMDCGERQSLLTLKFVVLYYYYDAAKKIAHLYVAAIDLVMSHFGHNAVHS